MHLEFFVEEQSAEAALKILIPRILPEISFHIYPFQGKQNLLKNLHNRLIAYRNWITEEYKIIVLVDRDSDDCHKLKDRLETIASNVGLKTLTSSPDQFQVINRIAIEELEAWFFGDAEAIHRAYHRVPATLGRKPPYRYPDAINGGTWERLEKVLKHSHPGGLEKIRAARDISAHMDPDRNCSPSFQAFRDALKSIPEQEQGE